MVKSPKQTQHHHHHHHHHTKSIRKLSCLFSCFGFSGKVSDKKSGDGKIKRRMSWFFRSKSKNSVTYKTVPVDVSPEKFKPRSPVETQVKTKSKSVKSKSSKLQDKDKLRDISRIPAHDLLPADLDNNNSVNNNSLEINYESKEDKILPGNKSPITDSSTKDDTSQRRSSQKPKTKYKGASSQGKGSHPSEVHWTTTDTLVAHSTSFNSQEQPLKKNNDDRAREFNPMVGLSVIMVTLIVMVLWGKMCAILCTSAWLYIISFYRNSVISNVGNNNKTKMIEEEEHIAGSMEYKRRVVLEGFLKRSDRN